MSFDLSTAFAVKERKDGLLEKDTFDLSTAVSLEEAIPLNETPVPSDKEPNWALSVLDNAKKETIALFSNPNEQVYTGRTTLMKEADIPQEDRQYAEPASNRPGYFEVAEKQSRWEVAIEQAANLAVLAYAGVTGFKFAKNELAIRAVARNVSKEANILADESIKVMRPEELKAVQSSYEATYDTAILNGREALVRKYEDALLQKLSAYETVGGKVQTVAEGEIAKTKVVNLLYSELKNLNAQLGEAGEALIKRPKIGDIVSFKKGEQLLTGAIESITGNLASINLGKGAEAVVASLNQLSLPKVEEVKPTEGKVEQIGGIKIVTDRGAIPGEPLQTLGNKAALIETEGGKFYIQRADESLIRNPKNNSPLFNNTQDAWEQYKLSTPTGQKPIEKALETKPPEPPIETPPQTPIPPETPMPPSLPPPEPSMPQEPDPVKKVIEALKEAKPIRAEQEALMKAERGRRIMKAKAMGEKIGGEAGFRAQLGSLKGALPKAQFETLRGKITQPAIDSLFNKIRQSEMNEWDKIGAQTGLGKLFGEFGGQVPTEGELKVLHEVFGKEFTDALVANRTLLQKFMYASGQLLNMPRAVMASFDLSAPLRQGAFMIGRPKQFVPAFGEMFKFFGSEKALTESTKNIESRLTYALMREHGLALMDLGTSLSGREEKFMSSWAEKIPLAGAVIRASNRAYTGFLNKLRADVFDDLYNKAKSLGIEETDKFMDDLVEFINAATGRGKLPGKLEKAAVALNSVFFSPRLMASRISLLNPMFYTSKEPFVRKEALKSLLTFASVVSVILGLLALSGVEVGDDWRSSDFAKIKIGDTRIDILAGFQQYIRMAGQLITGEYVSSSTGKVLTLGEGYKPLTRFDIVLRQLENKEAPVASFISTLLKQKTFLGEDVNITQEIATRFTPMVLSNLVELAQESPELLPLGVLGLFGVGVQTYQAKSRLSSGGLSKTKRGLK